MANQAILGALLLVALCTFIHQASSRAHIPEIDGWYPGVGPGISRPNPWRPNPWGPYPWGPYPWEPYTWGRRCRRNEVYKRCVSSSCSEGKCWKPNVGPACTKDCVSGCFCKNGFFRNRWDQCVRWKNCRKGPRPPVYPPHPGPWWPGTPWPDHPGEPL
uniref:Putative tick til 3 n=1 Tax=Amblyomma parvum TaxID=251391 RepID=A0A023FXN7_AMBPA